MRDDFANKTRTALASRAGYLCSNPACRVMTVGPSREAVDDIATVGVAAHICGAAPGGPRYDPAMSSEDRSSIENGIWLCAKHATLVDRDVIRFTVAVLRRWKAEHEAYVERNLGEVITREATPALGGRPISVEAARIASERTLAWEHRLFGQLLRDEIQQTIDDSRHLAYGIALGQIRFVEPKELPPAIRRAMSESRSIVEAFTALVNKALPDALGPEGQPGDPDLLAYVARSIGELHRKTIQWGLEWVNTKCRNDECESLIILMPELMRETQNALARIPDRIDAIYELALAALSPETPSYSANLTIELTIPDHVVAAITSELERHALLLYPTDGDL